MALLYAVIVILVTTAMSLPPVIRIGAIFTEDQKDSPSEMAFKYAVYRINKDKNLLPNTTLVYDIQYVPKDDSFRTSKKACKQLSRSVQGIFGPSDPLLGAHIQSICEALDVPHLEARVDFEPTFKEFSINLYPAQDHLNRAFRDLMSFLNWTRVAIIYEENYGLFKLQDLVKSPPTSKTEMYIRQAGPGSYRQVLREVRHKEIYKLIIDTDPANMQQFFRAILQLQMNDYRYHYMFTTFDIETFDLEDFKYNSVNMTAFRLVDLEEPKVSEILRQMERFQPIGHAILNKTGVIQAEPALMYDSVQVFAHGLAALDRSHILRPANLSCEKEEPWDDGLSLYNYINSVHRNLETGLNNEVTTHPMELMLHNSHEISDNWKNYGHPSNFVESWPRESMKDNLQRQEYTTISQPPVNNVYRPPKLTPSIASSNYESSNGLPSSKVQSMFQLPSPDVNAIKLLSHFLEIGDALRNSPLPWRKELLETTIKTMSNLLHDAAFVITELTAQALIYFAMIFNIMRN